MKLKDYILSDEQSKPFDIKKNYFVYAIDDMSEEQIDMMNIILKKCFIKLTKPNKKMYALDWQHTSFLYEPKIVYAHDGQWIDDQNGGFMAYFPTFYPDGDYYFFVEENFEFGLLGHPWRQEIWIFGSELINILKPHTDSFGWIELKRNE